MFLKSMVFGKDFVFQYLNGEDKANRVVAVRMIQQFLEYRIQLNDLYEAYLGVKVGLLKFSFDSKCELLSISCSTELNGIVGSFVFVHEFKRYHADELEQFVKQDLNVLAMNASLLNSVYDVFIALSVFVEENLLNIIAVNSDQLALFDEKISH